MAHPFKHVLVTGGAGYVGSTLVGHLLREGYRVTALDNLRFGAHGILPYFSNKNFRLAKGDIRNGEVVEGAAKDADGIIHLAAIVGFPACRKEPELSREVNVRGTENVVRAARGEVPILFASTGSNYGKLIEKFCTETTPLNPLTHYARQKAEAEEIVKKNRRFVIFRFATAFGVSPRMRLDLLPNDFTYRAVRERSLIVYEKHFMRTFIHVRDMARAFLFALENFELMNGEIYNVGDNAMNYSKEDICNLIRKKVDYYLHFADSGHDLDERDYRVSYEKLEKLGFRAEVTMEDGIDELIRVSEHLEISNPYYNA